MITALAVSVLLIVTVAGTRVVRRIEAAARRDRTPAGESPQP
ncbi:hypothetical protein ACIQAC_38650 [Streptomyces sp. NPDC088387]